VSSSNFDYTKTSCKNTLTTVHKKQVNGVVFFHEETLIATYSDDTSILIYNPKNGDLLNTLVGHTDRVLNMIKLKDGSLVSASADKKIKVWNPFKATCEKTLSGHTGPIWALLEFPNLILVSGSSDKTIHFWDLKEKEGSSQNFGVIKTIKADNQGRVMTIALITNDELAAGSEYNINIISLNTDSVVKTLTGHEGLVRDLLVYSYEKSVILSSSDDKTIRVWDWKAGSTLTVLVNNAIGHKLLMFNNDVFVSANDDGSLKFYDDKKAEALHTITVSKEPITNITKTIDGTVVTTGADKNVKYWSLEEDKL